MGRPRRRIIILVVVAVLVILALSLRSLAGLYTDSLWYSSIHQHEVFSTVLTTKIGLFLVFGLVFFLAMWGNLLLCNRLGPSELFLDAPEDELVRRFQSAVRPVRRPPLRAALVRARPHRGVERDRAGGTQ